MPSLPVSAHRRTRRESRSSQRSINAAKGLRIRRDAVDAAKVCYFSKNAATRKKADDVYKWIDILEARVENLIWKYPKDTWDEQFKFSVAGVRNCIDAFTRKLPLPLESANAADGERRAAQPQPATLGARSLATLRVSSLGCADLSELQLEAARGLSETPDTFQLLSSLYGSDAIEQHAMDGILSKFKIDRRNIVRDCIPHQDDLIANGLYADVSIVAWPYTLVRYFALFVFPNDYETTAEFFETEEERKERVIELEGKLTVGPFRGALLIPCITDSHGVMYRAYKCQEAEPVSRSISSMLEKLERELAALRLNRQKRGEGRRT